jgi:hypothetical protein
MRRTSPGSATGGDQGDVLARADLDDEPAGVT